VSLVTIVIPTWNGRQLLGSCLESLRAITAPAAETIVVDNGSDDGTAAFVRSMFPEVTLVELGRNHGFAFATNAGLRLARSPYAVLLNNDVVVSPSWLDELVACIVSHPNAAAAAPKLLRAGQPDRIDRVGDILSRRLRAYPRGSGAADSAEYNVEGEVFGVSGAASLWRVDVLRELGWLDEGFYFSYEDVDLSLRARLGGYELWAAPAAVAYHRGAASSGGEGAFRFRHPTAGRWRMILKSVPLTTLLLCAGYVAATELATLFVAAREGGLRELVAGYGDVARSSNALLSERRRVQHGRKIGGIELWRSLAPAGSRFPHRPRRRCGTRQ
jgi:GT2 family glycosyltransferase